MQLENVIDVLPLLSNDTALTVVDDIVHGKYKQHFKPSTKVVVLEKAANLGISGKDFDFMKKHLGFLNLIQSTLDEVGRPMFTPALLHSFEKARGAEETVNQILIGMAMDGYTFNTMSTLLGSLREYYGLHFEISQVYENAIDNALTSEKAVKILQVILDALAIISRPSSPDIEFDEEGWGFDDDFDVDEPGQSRFEPISRNSIAIEEILNGVKSKVEHYLLDTQDIEPPQKLRLLDFFEKVFVIN